MIKIEPSLESMCSVMMEEFKEFNCEEEKPRKNRNESMRGDIERHTCTQCFKSYIHAWHLKRHMKFECGQEPRVQCPYCSIKMKQRGHVYRHIRQCHRGKKVYVIDLNWEEKTARKPNRWIYTVQCFFVIYVLFFNISLNIFWILWAIWF
jgi:DNA-directed RNA polymerase subunit RPC12/RpoP